MDTGRAGKLLVAVLLAGALLWWLARRGDLSVTRVGPKVGAGSQVVMLLHGYGAPGNDLVGLAEEGARARPEATFLLPAGPHRAGLGGRSWLPSFSAPTREQYVARLDAELQLTLERLRGVIDEARRQGAECRDITVGGFSQGGYVAAALALSAPADCPLGGLIVMSGGGASELPLPPAAGRPRLRVLVSHGRRDGIVGFGQGQETARNFANGAHDVRALWFDGPHSIPPDVRRAIPRFLAGEAIGEEIR